ncbi:MAG TPA: hypothetical protein VFF81_08905 [Noviherbaspirillum sp.]|nr:hypothetical protein [Noviherbaspirillum sp.]
MSNCDHRICITPFQEMADNTAKSININWGEFAHSLAAGHPIVSEDKTLLPLFNAWRYKDVSDPSVDNGVHKDGTPIKLFSPTHVRRHTPNLVELSMLVLDFDGALPITEVDQRFGNYEYVCYTSLNHQVESVDKFRVVLPFSNPMPVTDFKRLQLKMTQWAIDQRADGSTCDIGRMFILPAVREEHRSIARTLRNHGTLFDWRVFESMPKPDIRQISMIRRENGTRTSSEKLKPHDVLETAAGRIVVRSIDRKISYVRCPFHADRRPSEFVDVTRAGTPYLVCKKCGTIYMERIQSDPIIDGIAKIKLKRQIKGGNQ